MLALLGWARPTSRVRSSAAEMRKEFSGCSPPARATAYLLRHRLYSLDARRFRVLYDMMVICSLRMSGTTLAVKLPRPIAELNGRFLTRPVRNNRLGGLSPPRPVPILRRGNDSHWLRSSLLPLHHRGLRLRFTDSVYKVPGRARKTSSPLSHYNFLYLSSSFHSPSSCPLCLPSSSRSVPSPRRSPLNTPLPSTTAVGTESRRCTALRRRRRSHK
jgi:hypothetical protein